MMNMTTMRIRVQPILLCGALLSCQGNPAGEHREGLDETLQCPDGLVGWNYRTHPPRTLTQEFEDSAELLRAPWAINIAGVDCDGDPTTNNADERRLTRDVSQICGAQTECAALGTICPGRNNGTITYNCGFDDTDPDDSTRIRRRTQSTQQRIDCGARPDESETLPERSACIPRYCHGRARRDDALNCMADTTIPVVSGLQVTPKTLVANPPGLGRADNVDPTDIFFGANYDFDLTVDYGTPAANVPEDARLTVWMADLYGGSKLDDPGSILAFRCVWRKFDVGRTQATNGTDGNASVHIQENHPMPENCFTPALDALDGTNTSGAHPQVQADLERRGLTSTWRNTFEDAAGRTYRSGGTFTFYSYDVEGRTLMLRSGESESDACMPNGPAFFWKPDTTNDTEAGMYDMVGYLRQREVARGPRPRWLWQPTMRLVTGPTEFRVGEADVDMAMGSADTERNPGVTVTNSNVRSPSISVDYGWYVGNDYPGNVHPFSMLSRNVNPNMDAAFYLYPRDRWGSRDIDALEIARIPLTGITRNGATLSQEIQLLPNVRSRLYDPSSPHYVDPNTHGDMRTFEVIYCVEGKKKRPGGSLGQRVLERIHLVSAATPGGQRQLVPRRLDSGNALANAAAERQPDLPVRQHKSRRRTRRLPGVGEAFGHHGRSTAAFSRTGRQLRLPRKSSEP